MVGADLVYSADVVEKLCKTIVALGCSRVYYCAPSTGRAGSQEFLERLEKLGFDRHTIDAPSAYSEAPCDEAALYFPDLAQSKFKLHTFVRQEPASPSYQAMAYLIREDLKNGKLERGGQGKELRPERAAQAHHDAEGRQAREGGHPGRPFRTTAAAALPAQPGGRTIRPSDKENGPEPTMMPCGRRRPSPGSGKRGVHRAGAFGYSSSKRRLSTSDVEVLLMAYGSARIWVGLPDAGESHNLNNVGRG